MWRRLLLPLALGACALAIRLPGIGAILTVDEPQWIFRADAFYRALRVGDIGGTFQGTHPGVIPMLLIGGGVQLRELATGTALDSTQVGPFRLAAKLPIAGAVSAAIGIAAAVAARLWGTWSGVSVGALLALDPFLLGHSQLAHLDALLAVFMALSVLTLFRAARTGRARHLLLSAGWGGLALLTKLPAVFLFPLTLFVLLLTSGRTEPAPPLPISPLGPRGPRGDPRQNPLAFRQFLIWSAAALCAFFLLWPSMWLNALPNIRYLSRDAQTVATVPHGGESAGTTGAGRETFYLRALFARTSPVILLLGLGGALVLLRSRQGAYRREGLVLLAAIVGFLIFLSVAEKKADRYLLPALAFTDVLAGAGLAALLTRRRPTARPPVENGLRRSNLCTRLAPALPFLGAAALLGLAVSDLRLPPYAASYLSPLAWREEPTQSGWGEGLERAAAVLNAHPLAPEVFVASWYPAAFREFFHGTTMSLSSRDDPRVSFVVSYRNMRGRGPESQATTVLEEYAGKTPSAIIRVLGREVAWIYRTDSFALFPATVGELVRASAAPAGGAAAARAVEIGQFVVPEQEPWSGVRIAFATFSSRRNTGEVLVHIREDPDGADLRTVRLDVQALADDQWQTVVFPALTAVKGKRHYVAVTSLTGVPGNAITVRYQPVDILPGAAVALRRPLRAGERRAQFQRTGDLALDLVYRGP